MHIDLVFRPEADKALRARGQVGGRAGRAVVAFGLARVDLEALAAILGPAATLKTAAPSVYSRDRSSPVTSWS